MRVTNSMLVKDMLWNSNNNLVQMAKKQNEMSTGKVITRPSDDPVGITQVLKYKTDIRESKQYSKNITDALGWLEVSESSVTNIKDILQRVRELTVQAANGTNTAEDTQKIMTEVEEMTKEIIVAGNATSAGRYLFTGLETNKKLFNPDGTFNIDMTTERRDLKHVMGYEVSVGETMPIGVHSTDLFGAVSSNSFFDGILTRNKVDTNKATQSFLSAGVDLTHNFTTDVLDLEVAGITYNVDESLLVNTPMNPLTKERFVDVLKTATDGTTNLSEVADIYFDLNNKLVVQAKNYGAATVIDDLAFSTSGGITGGVVTAGTNGTTATITGTGILTDADVLADTGKHTIILQLDDVRKSIEVDFSGLNTVADLQTALQGQINASFPPAGTITASAVAGGTLNFTINGINDGEAHSLSMDYVVSQESEMISDLQDLIGALGTKDDAVIQTSLAKLDVHLDKVLTVMGELGGKTNRIEFILSRVEENEITFTSLLSKVQDVDMAEAIMYFKNLENIYRASLSVGSKVIQPSLVDFIN